MKATRSQVVRFLLEAQGLTTHRRTDTLAEIRRLECVQIDPVAAVERNQHLVLSARIPSYRPESLDALLAAGKTFEYFANAAMVMPIEDYPIFAGSRRRYTERVVKYLEPLGAVPDEIRSILRERGPQPARAFESSHRVRGWWDTKGPKTKATSYTLGLLLYSGEVMVVKREGTTRFFDLAEHAVRRDLFEAGRRMPTEEADALLFAKYCRGLRIFDNYDPHFGWRRPFPAAERKKALGHEKLVSLEIEGVKRRYWMLESDVESLEKKRRQPSASVARFLPPLDNLMWHRRRLEDLFGFEYRWEVYTPAARRRYGYYAMPILLGDRLIGRIDPRLDRERNVLVVRGPYLERGVRMTKQLRATLTRSLTRFARWHGAEL
ncbi:MAG TPA: crosslink repair DNA glycosylase YcaQ family protein [Gemmatimonadaceae bacterium]|nr:crosslink repair DNA glycosylase YcaQ family protein [Gemmatimonadaceae bacterium]